MLEDEDQATGYACFAALQALVIVLSERRMIEGEDLREALEEAAASERVQTAEGAGAGHRKAAVLLDGLVRDSYAAQQS